METSRAISWARSKAIGGQSEPSDSRRQNRTCVDAASGVIARKESTVGIGAKD